MQAANRDYPRLRLAPTIPPVPVPVASPATGSDAPEPSGAGSGPGSGPGKRNFPTPAELPTQAGPSGIRFDFNDGCRVAVPEPGGPWRIRLSDLDTGNMLYETTMPAGRVNSAKRYFLRVRLEVSGPDGTAFTHDYDAAGREVLVQFPVGTLGDVMGWFPAAVAFQRARNCRLSVSMADWLIPLFRDRYPEITFLTHDEVRTEQYYATYNIGLFFDDDPGILQPCDFRLVGLHRTASYILGVEPSDAPPLVSVAGEDRPIAEPYVCIAAQSTTQCKYWNNPNGWRELVGWLKQCGYRVVCIDQKPVHGGGLIWNHIPYGAEDLTGDRPLAERVQWLRHAAFFVGLSSGLSWLAWAAEIPVVMISGFTHPVNEFATPYRVINYHACNSCWNDGRVRFDHKDFLWCPRHKDTPRQFECTRLITTEQVKATIRRIPGFTEEQAAARDRETGRTHLLV